MKINILKARIKRNKLVERAGEFYRDENSKIVTDLVLQNKGAILGIQRDHNVYTILGDSFVYFGTLDGKKEKISLNDFRKILMRETKIGGKTAEYEFLEVDKNKSIWVCNKYCMSSLWNTVFVSMC